MSRPAADGLFRPTRLRRRPAVFLDRDGTLNEEVGYLRSPEALSLVPGAREALRALQAAGFTLVVVTNQAGVGRGLLTPDQVEEVHARLADLLAGVRLDFYWCPHAPGPGNSVACGCRKPAPGLVFRAASELGLDLGASFLVGDRLRDVEAARAAGCRWLLLDPAGKHARVWGGSEGRVARSWREALRWILRRPRRPSLRSVQRPGRRVPLLRWR